MVYRLSIPDDGLTQPVATQGERMTTDQIERELESLRQRVEALEARWDAQPGPGVAAQPAQKKSFDLKEGEKLVITIDEGKDKLREKEKEGIGTTPSV